MSYVNNGRENISPKKPPHVVVAQKELGEENVPDVTITKQKPCPVGSLGYMNQQGIGLC